LIVTAVIMLVILLIFGNLLLKLHTLPERLAHKGQKLQFEIVAVLGLLALFTQIHAFWVAGLLLALIDLPDFGTPLGRMASSVERIAAPPPRRTIPLLTLSRLGSLRVRPIPGWRHRRCSAGARRPKTPEKRRVGPARVRS
jgi:hypothetical protein